MSHILRDNPIVSAFLLDPFDDGTEVWYRRISRNWRHEDVFPSQLMDLMTDHRVKSENQFLFEDYLEEIFPRVFPTPFVCLEKLMIYLNQEFKERREWTKERSMPKWSSAGGTNLRYKSGNFELTSELLHGIFPDIHLMTGKSKNYTLVFNGTQIYTSLYHQYYDNLSIEIQQYLPTVVSQVVQSYW